MPAIAPPAPVKVTLPEEYRLANGIELFGFNGEPLEILNLSLVFDAGRWTESRQLTASACADLLKSGTKDLDAFAIETKIDYLGSTIKASSGYNSFSINVYCMTRHLEPCLEILVTLLRDTEFSEKELELNKTKRQARLKINEKKNDFVGDMLFKEALFGPHHPYGYPTTAAAIDALDRDALTGYYRRSLNPGACYLVLAGNYTQKEIDLLDKYLGNETAWGSKADQAPYPDWKPEPSPERFIHRELKDSVQASIYVGGLSIPFSHPDFVPLSLLHLIYGGYFGSRLMKNIREEKGLTYGIYSYFQQYRHANAFFVNTETAVEHVGSCLDEIYADMDRLKSELVPADELTMARNYYLGRMLEQFDGPFRSASAFKGAKNHGIPMSYFLERETIVRQTGPDKLMELAQKYFDRSAMYEVVVK